MIDTAIPDMTSDGLINFDKRRKEFEVLAQVMNWNWLRIFLIDPLIYIHSFIQRQIKLLQGAANSYQITSDPRFERWFESLMVLDDREAYELSCLLEPHSNSSSCGSTRNNNSDKFRRKQHQPGHRKNDSIASTSSSSSSQFQFSELDGGGGGSASVETDRKSVV